MKLVATMEAKKCQGMVSSCIVTIVESQITTSKAATTSRLVCPLQMCKLHHHREMIKLLMLKLLQMCKLLMLMLLQMWEMMNLSLLRFVFHLFYLRFFLQCWIIRNIAKI